MNIWEVEKYYFKNNYQALGAIDEAGRGPLAGPVVAACILVVPEHTSIKEALLEVKDSKLLSPKKRNMLYKEIFRIFPNIGVGICDNNTIDRVNILQATFLAMKKAISVAKLKPDLILLDGNQLIPNISIAQKAIIKGDNLLVSIAAASIVAKVTRDRIMEEADKQFPQYFFKKHKGYGTKIHMEQINKYGPCSLHRKSFKPIKKLIV